MHLLWRWPTHLGEDDVDTQEDQDDASVRRLQEAVPEGTWKEEAVKQVGDDVPCLSCRHKKIAEVEDLGDGKQVVTCKCGKKYIAKKFGIIYRFWQYA